MRGFSAVCLLLACSSSVAFSLQRPTKITTKQLTAKANNIHSNPTFLKAEDASVIAAAPAAEKGGFLSPDNLKLTSYLFVWYLGNVFYNIYNKKACIALGKNAAGHSNAHWALSAIQLFVGVLFVIPMWLTGVRKSPELTADNWKQLAPVGLFASLSHAFSVLALGAGAVSFGQIVKAGEPVFAAGTNAILLGQVDHPVVYLALLPIIGGVGLASLKELSFSWTALIAASAANQAAALKNVVSKGVMGNQWAKNLGPTNTYAVVNILALIFTIPFVLAFDLKDFSSVYNQVMAAGAGADVLKYSAFSGLAFYLYNEASFLALSKLDAVSHSVANTLKRVVIIVASCMVFKTPMTLLGGIGSGIAVLGTLLYSLAKGKYSKK